MASVVKRSSMNFHNLQVLAEYCEVNEVLRTISPRWKMQILFCISQGIYQFSLLKRVFPSISDQVLGKRLGELVNDALVVKEVVEDKTPVHIIYHVTEKGEALLEIVQQLHLWGKRTW
jgi:DNA-binding HxlR family transcriptional regulator